MYLSLPLEKSCKVFWCFQGVQKGCIGNEQVKEVNGLQVLTTFAKSSLFLTSECVSVAPINMHDITILRQFKKTKPKNQKGHLRKPFCVVEMSKNLQKCTNKKLTIPLCLKQLSSCFYKLFISSLVSKNLFKDLQGQSPWSAVGKRGETWWTFLRIKFNSSEVGSRHLK